jgi:hypothetical protein
MGIDATAIAWYAAICGVLSAFAPALGGRAMRIGIGAAVGIAAATLLPIVKSGLAY